MSAFKISQFPDDFALALVEFQEVIRVLLCPFMCPTVCGAKIGFIFSWSSLNSRYSCLICGSLSIRFPPDLLCGVRGQIRTTWPGRYPWSLRLGIKHFFKLHPEVIIAYNQELVGTPEEGDRAHAVHAIGEPRPWRTVKRVYIPAVLLLFDHNHAGKSLRLRQKQCLEVAAVSAVKCGTFQSFERSLHR